MTEQETKKNELEITEQELLDNTDIEERYQTEIQAEIPDLWNRIETALPDKAPSNVEPQTGKVISMKAIRTIALIAACLCIALMIPRMLSVGGRHSEAAAESTAPAGNAAMADAAMAEEPAMEEEAPAAEAAPEMTEEAPAADESKTQSATEQVKNERNDFGSDALYTEGVEVEIIECDTELGKSDDDGYCTFTIMILRDDTGMYEQASIMDVYIDEKEAAEIKGGDKLIVTLVNTDPLSSAKPRISMITK